MPTTPFTLTPQELYADTLHHYLRELPHALDTKIEIFFAIVLGVLLFHVKGITVIPSIGEPAAHGLELSASLMDFAAVTLLLVSMICALLVVWPRLSGNAKGLSSFMAIASRSSGAAYAEEVLTQDGHALATALLVHCYELAAITRRKIVWCRFAMAIGLAGISVTIISQVQH
jgi:hypothetical protein